MRRKKHENPENSGKSCAPRCVHAAGLRGVRVGEASHPGPAKPAKVSPAKRRRELRAALLKDAVAQRGAFIPADTGLGVGWAGLFWGASFMRREHL